ncbi:hypothetical protein QTP88_020667 [Uroleucon formosanum]
MSEYERLCDIIQNNKQLNNTFNVECDDKVRIKEASGKGDAVLRGEEHVSLSGHLVLWRKIGIDCKCKNKICFLKVSDEEKNIIINIFNKIVVKEKQDRYIYIADLIKLYSIVRRRPTDNSKFKSYSCIYFMRIKEVEKRDCKSLQNDEPKPLDKSRKHNTHNIGYIRVHIGNFTAKDHFILQKLNTTLSLPTNDSLLNNGPLSIKEAKI